MNDLNTAIASAGGGQDKTVRTQEPSNVAVVVKPELDAKEIESLEVSVEQLEQMVARLNQHAQAAERDLEFSLDEDTGKTVITVLDRNTSEVIRQLPNDVTLNLARQLNDGDPIHLFSAQA